MLFSLGELFDIAVMTFVVGFIFKDLFRRRPRVEVLMPGYDPLKRQSGFSWGDFWFAAAVVAPSIILHEFGHKFTALAFGLSATFHASYTGLGIGVLLKLLWPSFVFFIPAYVSISGAGPQIAYALSALAGPAVNLLLWLIPAQLLRSRKIVRKMKGDLFHIVFLTSRINMFLFIFNILPIPGFDGWSVFSYLLGSLF